MIWLDMCCKIEVISWHLLWVNFRSSTSPDKDPRRDTSSSLSFGSSNSPIRLQQKKKKTPEAIPPRYG